MVQKKFFRQSMTFVSKMYHNNHLKFEFINVIMELNYARLLVFLSARVNPHVLPSASFLEWRLNRYGESKFLNSYSADSAFLQDMY